MKLSDDDKIQIVTSILIDRKKTKDVCDQLQICKETVDQLVAYYKQNGADGISRSRNKGTYSREFKSDVIECIMQSHDSHRNAAIRFNAAKSDVRQRCLLLRKDAAYSTINHKKVQKVMHEMGLSGYISRNGKRYSSYKGRIGKIADNLVQREFDAPKPNTIWSTDMTGFRLVFGQ